MTVSVRMEAHLESEIEKTAKLRGITKSQFIIEAVERALGRKEPYQLLLQVRERRVMSNVSAQEQAENQRPLSDRLREKLSFEHSQKTAEWLTYHGNKNTMTASKASAQSAA